MLEKRIEKLEKARSELPFLFVELGADGNYHHDDQAYTPEEVTELAKTRDVIRLNFVIPGGKYDTK